MDEAFCNKLKVFPGYDEDRKSEMEYLRTHLFEDENILAIISGLLGHSDALFVYTDKRLMLIYGGGKYSEIMLNKISSVTSAKAAIGGGEIQLEDGTNTWILKQASNKAIQPFVDAVHKVAKMSHVEATTIGLQGPKTSASVADEILKFKQLLDNGIIMQEEFEQQKKKMLGM